MHLISRCALWLTGPPQVHAPLNVEQYLANCHQRCTWPTPESERSDRTNGTPPTQSCSSTYMSWNSQRASFYNKVLHGRTRLTDGAREAFRAVCLVVMDACAVGAQSFIPFPLLGRLGAFGHADPLHVRAMESRRVVMKTPIFMSPSECGIRRFREFRLTQKCAY